MSEWLKSNLGKHVENKTKKADTIAGKDIKYVALEHIRSEAFKLINYGWASTTSSANTLFVKGDVLFGKLRPYLRKSITATFDGCCTGEILVLCSSSTQLDQKFLAYLFQHEDIYQFCESLVAGTKMPRISWGDLKSYPLVLPPVVEQKKITEIIYSVDKVIDLTEIVIEKRQNLKKGLMRDLLTKGIGKTKFKESTIGKIPESWEVCSVQDLGNVIDSLHKTPEFSESGYYMVRVTDIIEGALNFCNSLKVSKEVYLDFSRNHKPTAGDIVMTRVGSFGRSSYVDSDVEFCIGQNTVIIHPNKNPKYLYYCLNSELVWNQIVNETNGSSQGSLSLKAIKNLKIAVPPDEEVLKIESILNTIDNEISGHTLKLRLLKDLKIGLMQDLLTGKVRIKI